MNSSAWTTQHLLAFCNFWVFHIWREYHAGMLLTKSSLIALIAIALVRTMRIHTSAATRHLALMCAIAAILSLQLFAALPSWTLARMEPMPSPPALSIPIGPSIKIVTTFDKTGARPEDQKVVQPTPQEANRHRGVRESVVTGQRQLTTYIRGSITSIGIVFFLGDIVSTVLVIQSAMMLIGLTRLARRSRPAGLSLHAYLPPELTHVRIRLGGAAPMTWGCVRPILLLPIDAEDWPEERLRAVILHECAHIARQDWLTQMLARAACILYCFNPLIWFLAKEMRREAEIACDDAVLIAGVTPANYASHLIDIARLLKAAHRMPAGTIAMASRSEVGPRVAAILDKSRPRAIADTRTRIDNLCAAAMILFALGTCGVTVAKSPRPPMSVPLTPDEIAMVHARNPVAPTAYRTLIASDRTLFDIDYTKPPDPPVRTIARLSNEKNNGVYVFCVEIPAKEISPQSDYRLIAIGNDGYEMPVKFGSGETSRSFEFLARNHYAQFLFVVSKENLPWKHVQELRFEVRNSNPKDRATR